MKLTFFGAARAVTGSCHCVECGGEKILVDYGLRQGRDKRDSQELDLTTGYIDAVVVTHAHINHSGRIPLLVKQGFIDSICCTHLTGQLLSIMLRDSVHIQENDAQQRDQKSKRIREGSVEPFYTVRNAEGAVRRIVICEYGITLQIVDRVKVRFVDAGHLLDLASMEIWLTGGDTARKVVFSGDIGSRDQPIIYDPQHIRGADYVFTENIYDGWLHDMDKQPDYTADLAAIIDETLGNGGNMIIPSFAVSHAQELLYFIRRMKKQGLVRSVLGFSVVVNSPLTDEAIRVFSGDLHGYLDEEAVTALKGGALFQFPGLTITESGDESHALNLNPTPKAIVFASGICDAGRIHHHLGHNLQQPEYAVVFVGYQAEGGLGRRLLNGVGSARLFGEEITVRVRIVNFHGLSPHADRDGLLQRIEHFNPRSRQMFVVHGDQEMTEVYANTFQEEGLATHAPNYEETYDLLDNRMLSPGLPPKKKPELIFGGSPACQRLEDTGHRFMKVIAHNEGGTNKDLGRFADQLRTLIEKWDR